MIFVKTSALQRKGADSTEVVAGFVFLIEVFMAEYNKQRYFWIKLTDRFMTSDTVDFLMEQKDGANYVVLYQMLCLKTINNNGQLSRTLGEIIVPYDEEKIQRDMKWFSLDTIRVAMILYRRLGLIYEQEDGILRISNFERLVGSQTISAYKKQVQLQSRGGKKVEFFPLDIDKEKDIDIDNKKSVKRFTPPTLQDVEDYCFERCNNVDAQRFVDYYTSNGWRVGKNSMKDWKAAIRTWENSASNQNHRVVPQSKKSVDQEFFDWCAEAKEFLKGE